MYIDEKIILTKLEINEMINEAIKVTRQYIEKGEGLNNEWRYIEAIKEILRNMGDSHTGQYGWRKLLGGDKQ